MARFSRAKHTEISTGEIIINKYFTLQFIKNYKNYLKIENGEMRNLKTIL